MREICLYISYLDQSLTPYGHRCLFHKKTRVIWVSLPPSISKWRGRDFRPWMPPSFWRLSRSFASRSPSQSWPWSWLTGSAGTTSRGIYCGTLYIKGKNIACKIKPRVTRFTPPHVEIFLWEVRNPLFVSRSWPVFLIKKIINRIKIMETYLLVFFHPVSVCIVVIRSQIYTFYYLHKTVFIGTLT